MNLLEEIATILKTKPAKLAVRVIGLQLGDTCSRCGGCGRYSFNPTDGDTCYGCHGRGMVMVSAKRLPQLKEAALAAVADGKLDHYLDSLKARSRCRDASDRVFAAWHQVDAVTRYGRDWHKVLDAKQAASPSAEQIRLLAMAAINDRCVKAYEAFTAFEQTFQAAQAKDWTTLEAALNAALAELASAKRQALDLDLAG